MARRTAIAGYRWRRLLGSLVVVAIVAGACGGPVTTGAPGSSPEVFASPAVSTTPAPSAISRVDGWSGDIDLILDARDDIHPDGWHGFDRDAWLAAAADVKARLATMTDEAALTELVRLASMPSWNGRDGHSGIFPFAVRAGTHAYPILLWQFSDGLVITEARAPHVDLVGSRIESINGRPIAEVLALVEPLAPRDNPSNLLAYAPLYLRVSELLAGLGIIDAVGPAVFGVRDPSGAARDVTIEPIPIDEDRDWHAGPTPLLPTGEPLWLQDAAPLSWTYLEASRTVYVRYTSVRGGIDAVAEEILTRAKLPDVDRVVVDIRRNGGGDNTTFGPLQRVFRDPAIDRPGRLVILIGRGTFSAAANFATDLEQTTTASFAGEAMGGSPNLYGDVREVRLPYSEQSLFMAARYWERSTADDVRITIEPDLAVGLSSVDYLAGRDPVLDAVLAEPLPTD